MENSHTQIIILNYQDLERLKDQIVKEVSGLIKELDKVGAKKEYLTFLEAKKFFGCSKATLYRYMDDGLPSEKKGRKRYFKYSDLVNWIKNK